MRIVVFCPNPIGDAVMATPALRALREGYPDARIDVVVRPIVSATFDGIPWVDQRLLFDPRSKDRSLRSLALIRTLRANPYDLAVLLTNSFRTALLSWVGGAKRRVGYARSGRCALLTDQLPPIRDADGSYLPTPAVESYLALVRHLGCRVSSNRLELVETSAERELGDRTWAEMGLPDDGSVVCLNTGGAYGPAKAWPAEYFAQLARRLATEAGRHVLVICGPNERDAARAIAASADHPAVVSLAERAPSIGLSKSCLRRSGLLITTDSGPRHLATAFRVPVLTLFGPTFIAWTRTQHPQALHLQVPVPCGPCQRPVCPEGHHRCMRELLPDTVYEAALRLIGQGGSQRHSPPGRPVPHLMQGNTNPRTPPLEAR